MPSALAPLALAALVLAPAGAAPAAWAYEVTYTLDDQAETVAAELAGVLDEAIVCDGAWVPVRVRSERTTDPAHRVVYRGDPATLAFGWAEQREGRIRGIDWACPLGARAPLVAADAFPADGPWSATPCGMLDYNVTPFQQGLFLLCAPPGHPRLRAQALWGTPGSGRVPFTGTVAVEVGTFVLGMMTCVDSMETPGIVFGVPALRSASAPSCGAGEVDPAQVASLETSPGGPLGRSAGGPSVGAWRGLAQGCGAPCG